MNTKWTASLVVLAATFSAGVSRADDPNPEIAKVIQDIVARRAEKVEARVKQVEGWGKGEMRERGFRGGFGAGAAQNPAPGQPAQLKIIEKK